MKFFNIISLLAIILLFNTHTYAHQYHVRTNGLPSGNGSLSKPWDLQTALNSPPSIRPGDTIWLHGGVYAGAFTSNLQGTVAAPIKVRSYPGEWAIIDNAGQSLVALWVAAPKYVWFWGFEIKNSGLTPNRDESGVNFGSSEGMKLINVVVHDQGSTALNPWTSATNVEIYGCIVYYNGRMEDVAHKNGYGIYGQNTLPSRKTIEETFFFNMFSIFPVHYGGSSASELDNTAFIGNTIFGHTLYDGKNVIAIHGQFETGGGKCVQVEWSSNFFYRADLWLGYNSDGIDGMVLKDNYFFRGNVSNNSGNTYAVNTGNVYTSTGNQVFVRPNKYADQYDPRRANIIIFNGSKFANVTVTLPTGVLQVGDPYQIKDVQNYFGPPVTEGTYSGGTISVPMPGSASPITTPVSIPVERPASSLPSHTDNEFGAFVLLVK